MSKKPCGKEIMTRKQAMARAAWWRRARLARMDHYRCVTCGGWHVGNNKRKANIR